ncbi:oxidoreductase [bacterium E08(2017)]|nr:oxidoreductase [bacterium E08(2017)]
MKNFAITGVAGYIAPRHLQAIKATGNRLLAAVDPHDSVGILDGYFFDVAFFKEFERFDRYLEKLRRNNDGLSLDYLSICSPNYLHDAHIRFALREHASAICEKPLVLNPWNCDALQELEEESDGNVYTVLQLRYHPAILALKEKISSEGQGAKKHEVTLDYITSRGQWYLYSWKGDVERSGGLVTNIGIHFFDMLMWVFGPLQNSGITVNEPRKVSGELELENANVRWNLSIDREDLPESVKSDGQVTYRSIKVDGEEIEFSGGFTDLHTQVYEDILAGGGYRINDARPSIELVHDIRSAG